MFTMSTVFCVHFLKWDLVDLSITSCVCIFLNQSLPIDYPNTQEASQICAFSSTGVQINHCIHICLAILSQDYA